MKKSLSIIVLFLLLIYSTNAMVLAEDIPKVEEHAVLTIDLSSATDEELKQAKEAIEAEIKSRIVTKITLDQTDISIAKGKTVKIKSTVTDIPEGVKLTKTSWSSSDTKVAKVQSGTVTAVNAGNAIIYCTAQFSNGLELVASCNVEVVVKVSSISVSPNSFSIGIGNTQQLTPKVSPENATNKQLIYTSADSDIVSVNAKGIMTANHGGKTTITVVSTDGSEKKANVTVYVPSISASKTEYSIDSKNGKKIVVNYYGKKENLSLSSTGGISTSYSLNGHELVIEVHPQKAGSATITVSDKSDSKSKVALKIQVEHSAVYDSVSYPQIEYNNAARYPSQYKGVNCRFSGKVHQVMNGSSENAYRISSKGNWDDVVYVVIPKSNLTVPVLEDDKVTVYGKYFGNQTYQTIFGAEVTIPCVIAEKIEIK